MLKRLWLLVWFGGSVMSLAAGEASTPWLKTAADGTMEIDGVGVMVSHYAPGWKSTGQGTRSLAVVSGTPSGTFRGTFAVNGGSFEFDEVLKKDAERLTYRCRVTSGTGVPTQCLCVTFTLPAASYTGRELLVDGRSVVLSTGRERVTTLLQSSGFKQLEIPARQGRIVIAGEKLRGTVLAFRDGPYHLRLFFSPSEKVIRDAAISFTVRYVPFEARPVDLRQAANTGFRDPVADDRQGGWTDQGPERDLRSFKPGDAVFQGVRFRTIAPESNRGRSCIVLRGGQRPYFPASAAAGTDGKVVARNLYLLHATAWTEASETPVGSIRAIYADGSESVSEVKSGRDVADWTNGSSGANYRTAWSGPSAMFGNVYLHLSRFPLPGKSLKRLEFSSTGKSVWMICAASLSPDRLAPVSSDSRTVVYRADKNWVPITCPNRIVPGSALDFSFMLDAPAGKYGAVKCVNGEFRFLGAPDKKLRFYGTNLCFETCFLSNEESERLAEQLAAIGYNAVRFHHFDWTLTDRGSTALKPAELARFEYLIGCLRRKGIYYTLDLYTGRMFRRGDAKEFDRDFQREVKMLLPVCPDAMRNMQEFAGKLLCHVNPYTGLAMKDDPALLCVSLINENTLFAYLNEYPAITDLYRKKFAASGAAPATGKTTAERELAFYRYVVDLQIKSYEELKTYLRGLGVNKPFTDLNFRNGLGLTLTRARLDYVDNHVYWDGARYLGARWQLPYFQSHRSMIPTGTASILRCAATRIFGRPFTVTEFNSPFPNPYRAEMAPIIGSLAALQDWDAIFHYSHSHKQKQIFQPHYMTRLDAATDPMMQLSEKIGIMFFSGFAVKAASERVPCVMTPDYIESGLSAAGGPEPASDYCLLGLRARIGTVLTATDTPALREYPFLVVPTGMTVPEALKKYRLVDAAQAGTRLPSEAGAEIRLDRKNKTFTVVTPRAESISFCDAPRRLKGNILAVSGDEPGGTCFVGAIDGLPLERSRRLLALYLTNVVNTGMTVEYNGGGILRRWGDLPHLARRARLRFALGLSRDRLPDIRALAPDGAPKKRLEVQAVPGGFAFSADSVTDGNTFFAYEIVWDGK